MHKNKTSTNGEYDIEVLGLDEKYFNSLHIAALVCILISLISNLSVLILLLKRRKIRRFFTWTKSERCLVYIVIADGLFNTIHFPDHLQIFLTREHIYPEELCDFYAFMVYEFIVSQVILTNIVAINAFVLVYFRIKLDFGLFDYKILPLIFGLPAIVCLATTLSGMMGPNGAFCFFNNKKGHVAYLIFSTIPLLVVYIMNVILYILTWYTLRKGEPSFQRNNDGARTNNITKRSRIAARNMSLFVIAFFIQWSVVAIYGILKLAKNDIPQWIYHTGTVLPNLGGVLNVIIYVTIQRRKSILDIESVRRRLSIRPKVQTPAQSPGRHNAINATTQ